MFFHVDIKGDRLPDRTLCLTFDDGPGPRTLEIGQYLYTRKISATFFTIGRHMEEFAGFGRQLQQWDTNSETTRPLIRDSSPWQKAAATWSMKSPSLMR
jgi:peptidoglycan/xylan/chitin deacetylase (PgdA/CDA1 family)